MQLKGRWPQTGHEGCSDCHVLSLGERGSTAGPDPARQLVSCEVGADLNLHTNERGCWGFWFVCLLFLSFPVIYYQSKAAVHKKAQ